MYSSSYAIEEKDSTVKDDSTDVIDVSTAKVTTDTKRMSCNK